MISRKRFFGLGTGLLTFAVCLSFAPAALAQEPAEPKPEEEETAPPPAAAAPADAAPAAATTEKKEATAEAKVELTAKEPEPALKAAPADPEREKAVSAIGVERLPGSAYPSVPVRGISGGSLWLTMHGQQWPYMPALAGQSALRLGFSGSIWSDGSYAVTEPGLDDKLIKRVALQSRAVLRLTPTYSTPEGWFAQGQAELVAQGDQALPGNNIVGTTDDLYVRIGKWNVFDVTAGRFQAWEIANHYGMGLDLNTLERNGADVYTASIHPKSIYGLTYFWDRADYRMGSYAVHLYPSGWLGLSKDILRAEILGQFGEGASGSASSTPLQTNFRGSGILDLGFVKAKAGYEYGKAIPEQEGAKGGFDRNGFGVALQGVFDPYLEGGVSYAQGHENVISAETDEYSKASSNKAYSIAGFINGRVYKSLILGVGAVQSKWENFQKDERPGSETFGEHDTDEQLQAFGAIQYSFWDTFFIKFVGSYAKWKHQDRSSTPFENKQMGGRLRLMILY